MTTIERIHIMLAVGDGTTMAAHVAKPGDNGTHPGILVFQEAFGVNSHIRDICERFAKEGYLAIAPEFFHRTAPGFEGRYDDFPAVRPHVSALSNDQMQLDIRAANDWLFPRTNGDIVSIGFCMGGRVSFLANATVELRAAVSFYGGGIAAGLLDRVPHLHAPMMMFWGGLDKHIALTDIRAIVDALRRADKEYVNIEISHADHGFFCDARPSYNRHAAEQAWGLVLSFFKSHHQLV